MYADHRLTQLEVQHLQQPWTDQDIRLAITSWHSNKSPGPDGFSGEFYNTFLQDLLPDLREVFNSLNNQPHASLAPLNDSYIVLVPKKQSPLLPIDFRPISLVNAVQKIYSRIMAARVKPLLDRLLSSNQTGFLKNRSILHNFYYAQQVIQTAAKQKAQVAIFKADMFKAFDTLNWNFLIQTLVARGFPQQWIQAVKNIILLGTSRIIVNSIAGKPIMLKRGVRQGDPISPYLFDLAIDFLPRWINKLNELLFLLSPFPQCTTSLLYADDTLLFLKPTRDQLFKTKLIFDIFGRASGLAINLQKSELSITSFPTALAQDLADVIQCKYAKFPIKYLGLPLSDRRLARNDYLPLLERVQLALAGWKAPLLSIGGRIVLTNSVLTAVPQYFMSMFMLPKWAARKIDQIRRRFLWHGHKSQQQQMKGLYMVNWSLATKPRNIGGLGIRDIRIANQALLMKWMWLWLVPHNEWWKKANVLQEESDRPWNDHHALPFWKNVKPIIHAFECSTTYRIRQGNTVKFWHDNWCDKPLKYSFPNLFAAASDQSSSVQQNRTGQDWNPQFQHLDNSAQSDKARLLLHLQNTQTEAGCDEIFWLRKPPSFTVASAYSFLANTPSPHSCIATIWQIKAPLRVLVFAWLLHSNRLTTLDNLSRKGWLLPSMCIMCRQSEETSHHLFYTCALAKEVRDYIFVAFSARYSISNCFTTENSSQLLTAKDTTCQTRQWELATSFTLWSERCRRTFEGTHKQLLPLVREIKEKHSLWFSQSSTQ